MEPFWGATLSRDEDIVLTIGLDKNVTTPLLETPEGQMLVLFLSRISALLYLRNSILSGYFESGEYTLYSMVSLPPEYYSQEISIEFDNKELGSMKVVAVNPASIPGSYIRYAERRLIER
ncbi:hypothetical protein MUP59_05720 [Candidatus Bathyarchaeota archaeon]|nr:hypothetical protein [Candidatus Bathyarchaeota archaeon]